MGFDMLLDGCSFLNYHGSNLTVRDEALEKGLFNLVKYLVIKALSNNFTAINAILDYIVKNESPSTIAYKYGISKHQVRGYVQRILDKVDDSYIASKILTILYPQIKNIKSPISLTSRGNYCGLCNTWVVRHSVEEHIRRKHKDLVNLYTVKLINVLKSVKSERHHGLYAYTS